MRYVSSFNCLSTFRPFPMSVWRAHCFGCLCPVGVFVVYVPHNKQKHVFCLASMSFLWRQRCFSTLFISCVSDLFVDVGSRADAIWRRQVRFFSLFLTISHQNFLHARLGHSFSQLLSKTLNCKSKNNLTSHQNCLQYIHTWVILFLSLCQKL